MNQIIQKQEKWFWEKKYLNNIRYSQQYISEFFKYKKDGHISDLINKLIKNIKSLHVNYLPYDYEDKKDDPIFQILGESSISVINYNNKLWTISNRRFFCIKYALLNSIDMRHTPKIWVKYYDSPNDFVYGDFFIKNYNNMIGNIVKNGLNIEINSK